MATAALVVVLHWLRLFELLWLVPAVAVRPGLTNPTIGAGFTIGSEVAPLITMDA